METEKEIEIDGKKFVIRKLTFGQMSKLANLTIRNTPEHPCVDEIIETTVLFGLKSAPFPINLENIRNLDYETGLALFNAINDFNKPLDDLKKMLSEEHSVSGQGIPSG